MPLRHVLRNAASIPAQVQPNGDPLPNMPGGELPSYRFSVTGSNNIRTQNQQKIGIFTVIAAKTPYQPGVFLGVHLDARLARALEKFVR